MQILYILESDKLQCTGKTIHVKYIEKIPTTTLHGKTLSHKGEE